MDCICTGYCVSGWVFFLCFAARCRFTPCFLRQRKPNKKSIRLPSYTLHPSSPCFLRWSLTQSNDCVAVGDTWLCVREGWWCLPPPPGVAWHSRSPVSALLPLPHSSGFTPLPLLVRFRTFLLLLSDGDDAGHPPGAMDARGPGAPHCLPVSSLPWTLFFSQVSERSRAG